MDLISGIIGATVVAVLGIAVVTRVVQAIVARFRRRAIVRDVGWAATSCWAIGFAAFAFALLGMLSIGILVLPVALCACVFAAWRSRAVPEAAIGAAFGIGAICLYIGITNLGYAPCPAGGITLSRGMSFRCGGFDGTPWVAVAVLLLAAGALSALLMRRRATAARSPFRRSETRPAESAR